MSQGCKDLTRPSPTIHFKVTGLKLTRERSYQTHSHNTHFKITGLVRGFQEGETVLKQDTLLLCNPY